MKTSAKILINYQTVDGYQPFVDWLRSLRDKTTAARIRARIERVGHGNFGDVKSVARGISELRLAFGSGYRVYFGQDGDSIIILLIGGDKSTQEKDIELAQYYWADYKRRIQDEKDK